MNLNNISTNPITAYAVCSKNAIRKECSSGGAFYELATHILNYGGVVYGVQMGKDCLEAQYARITDIEDLHLILGSKYVQADIGGIFATVKIDLQKGNLVLFSGTPCQVNGLKNFLKDDYSNLICADIICHGVPQKKIWQSHVKYMEERFHSKLIGVNFRCKKYGWNYYTIKYTFEGKVKNFFKMEDPYLLLFLNNYSLLKSCYNCRAKTTRFADLTIGDFWGVDSVCPELNDGKGTSVIIIRTQKGNEFLEELLDRFNFRRITYKEAVTSNSAEYKSSICPPDRKNFIELWQTSGYANAIAEYTSPKKLFYITRIRIYIKSKLQGFKGLK